MSSHHRRLSRLFLDRDLDSAAVVLSEREAHYLGSVLRLKRGDRVLAFNGRGQERHASIRLLARRRAELDMLEPAAPLPESPLDLTLIQALPKAEAMDLIVQKSTELGVRRIAPVLSDFSVVRLDAERAARRAEHWIRVAQSACEQCGRHRPTEILPVATLEARLGALPAADLRIVLDTAAGGAFPPPAPPPARVCLLVGPEGGFSPDDLGRIDAHGFAVVGLGGRTLRTETAALVACGLLQFLWGDLH